MKRRPRPIRAVGRRRRIAGWVLLMLGVIVAGVWVASGWKLIGLRTGRLFLYAKGGSLSYCTCNPPIDVSSGVWTSDSPPAGWDWAYFKGTSQEQWPVNYGLYAFRHFSLGIGTGSFLGREYCVVLWPFPLLMGALAALLFRSCGLARRRARACECRSCGYSLAGRAPDSPCPECGKAPSLPSRPSL